MVWAVPRSLATTYGITIVFFSYGYLDVSVPHVRLSLRIYLVFYQMGCPIRKSTDQGIFAPPRSLSQLITSFVASETQGIRHAPLLTFFSSFSFVLLQSRWLDVFSFLLLLLQYVNDLSKPPSYSPEGGRICPAWFAFVVRLHSFLLPLGEAGWGFFCGE